MLRGRGLQACLDMRLLGHWPSTSSWIGPKHPRLARRAYQQGSGSVWVGDPAGCYHTMVSSSHTVPSVCIQTGVEPQAFRITS